MAAGQGSPGRRDAGIMRTELGSRVVSSVVLVAVALLLTYWGGWPFALLWLAAGIATAIEWTAMSRIEPLRFVQVLLGGTLAALTANHLLGGGFANGAAMVAIGALGAAVLARTARGKLWAVGGLGYALVISLVAPLVRDHPAFGLTAVLWMFAVVWGTDIAAYFTGRRLGGPKLWPRVSPKKTWSGFLGGLLAATLLGVAVVRIASGFGVPVTVGLGTVAFLSAVASVASQLGDLAESALKRRFDVKDSGHLIPGHGGVMDRVDGFWAVAVLAGIVLLAARFNPV
jgi:phosphatidate cytidylyltransferase